ncbi:hypothetical protein QQF64_018917, partial [Cirrhinus molitorella]
QKKDFTGRSAFLMYL